MQVSVRDLKNHLSKYLQKVKLGIPIIVTSHHIPLAKLIPIPQVAEKNIQQLLQIEGISWNGKKPHGGKIRPKMKGKTAAEYVLEHRR